MSPRLAGLAIALSLALGSSHAATTPAPEYALVFRNGVVYDGTGGAPFAGDVAIRDGNIVAVGPKLPGRGVWYS